MTIATPAADVINPALPAARAVFAAITSGDLGCLDAAVTGDFVDHGSPFPLPPGPEGYRQILTFVTRVLSIRYELMDEIVTADRIVVRALAHGTSVAARARRGVRGPPLRDGHPARLPDGGRPAGRALGRPRRVGGAAADRRAARAGDAGPMTTSRARWRRAPAG